MTSSPVPVHVKPPVNPEYESYLRRGWRKCQQQPFVPLGILATCIAFGGATRHLRSGNRASFNRFLRFRVVAQGLTIAACVGGSYYYGQQSKEAKAVERAAELEAIKIAGSAHKAVDVHQVSAEKDATAPHAQPDSETTGSFKDRLLSSLGATSKRPKD